MAEATLPFPLDPLVAPRVVADLLRTGRSVARLT
jgi:hypothetical protein